MIVLGRVQGVFFRRAAADQAAAFEITGFARNLPDGSVEIVAEGRRDRLEMLLAWANTGPPHARVDQVQAEWTAATNEFSHFKVR